MRLTRMISAKVFSHLLRHGRTLHACRKGAVLIMTALGMMSFFGVVSLSVDMAIYQTALSKTAAATDAAVLAAGRITRTGLGAEDWRAVCRETFAANLSPILRTKRVVTDADEKEIRNTPSITCYRSLTADGMSDQITAIATTETPTAFARILGIDALTMAWESQAVSPKDLEVSIVMDVSSSMNLCLCTDGTNCPRERGAACQTVGSKHGTRFEHTKKELTSFINTLFSFQKGNNIGNSLLRVTVVPFADAVNVGSITRTGNQDLRLLINPDDFAIINEPTGKVVNHKWFASRCLRSRPRYYEGTGTPKPHQSGYHCNSLEQPLNRPANPFEFSQLGRIGDNMTCPDVKEEHFQQLFDVNDMIIGQAPSGTRLKKLQFRPMQDNKLQLTGSMKDGEFGKKIRGVTAQNPWGFMIMATDRYTHKPTKTRLHHKACPENHLSIVPPQESLIDLRLAISQLRIDPPQTIIGGESITPTLFTHSNLTNGVAWGMRMLSPNWQNVWDIPGGKFPNETEKWRQGANHLSSPTALTTNRQTRKIMIIISDAIQEIYLSSYGTAQEIRSSSTIADRMKCTNRTGVYTGGIQASDIDESYGDSRDNRLFIDSPAARDDLYCYPTAVRELNYRLYKELCPALKRRGVEIFAIGMEPVVVIRDEDGNEQPIILRNQLERCVSEQRSEYFHSVNKTGDLNEAFQKIAESLTVLRLTRSQPAS